MTASATDAYSYRLEFSDEQRAPVHTEPLVAADFHRAIDTTFFTAFRQGVLPAYDPQRELARIEPVFAGEGLSARAKGFRVSVPRLGGEFTQEFGIHYFAARASRQRAGLRRDRGAAADASLYYALGAYLDDASAKAPAAGALTLDQPAVEIPVRTGSRRALDQAKAWDKPQPSDLPVLVARSLLEDACEEARRHPECEIGGLLLGHLRQVPEASEIFLEATCLASGEGTTKSCPTSVTFTSDSFAQARNLIRLRAQAGDPPEIVIGWYHSHPFRFCRECPLPTPPECLSKVLFYSDDDNQLMESTFYQPFMVGLLVAVEPRIEAALSHLPVKLYGWSPAGEIVPRGFEVID
jgi:proteasome lid subunit RPN8/RPN11